MLFPRFLDALNAAITAGWVVLVILVLRLLLRRAPRWIHCALWGVVALRLLLPFEIPSPTSLIPATEPVNWEYTDTGDTVFTLDSGIAAVDETVHSLAAAHPIAQGSRSLYPPYTLLPYLWLGVAGLLLLYASVQYIRLRRRLATATRLEGNLYQSERVSSPFILGLLRPRIYLPYGLEAEEQALILAHEQAHIRRRDPLTKLFAFVLVSLYWFQPLLWVAYLLLCRDMELACDQRAIRDRELPWRQAYSETLLRHSLKRLNPAACPLAFGEVGVKARIKSIMHYKKPAFWAVIAAAAAVAVAAVCLLTSPEHYRIDQTIAAYAQQEIQGRELVSSQLSPGIRTCAVQVFGMEQEQDTVTVYAHVMRCSYTERDGIPESTGSHTQLTVLTLIPTASGKDASSKRTWTVREYWTPTGEGADYTAEVQQRIPRRLQKKAHCDDETMQALQAECDRQARLLVNAPETPASTTASSSETPASTTASSAGTSATGSGTAPAPTVGLQTFDATVISYSSDGILYVKPLDTDMQQRMGNRVEIRRFQQPVEVTGLQPGDRVRVAYAGSRYPELKNPMVFEQAYDVKMIPAAGGDTTYRLVATRSSTPVLREITSATQAEKLGYRIFTYGLEQVYIAHSDYLLPLEQIPEGDRSIHLQKLLEQAETDAANGVCRPDLFKDGGTRKYMYENYTLFKMHRISGQNSYMEDVYITAPGVYYPTDINP